MATNTTFLITGAGRGIGRGLVAHYLSLQNHTIIAAVRTTTNLNSTSLSQLPKGPGSSLILIEIDALKEETPLLAIKTLKETHKVTHIDTVIANAGICDDTYTVSTVPFNVLKEHVAVNAYGPVLLFQAVLPLLLKSKTPKFLAMGSPIGSVSNIEARPFPLAAYGMSKTMLHWAVRKISFEHEEIVSFVVDPGFVQSDMGNEGARKFGLEKATTTLDECTAFLVSTIDGATKERTSGHFPSIEFQGGDYAW